MATDLHRLVNGCLLASFDGATLPKWLLELVEEGLGGVTLFAENIAGPEQLMAMTETLHAIRPDVVVALDEEGGDVTRLEATTGSSLPSPAALGAADDVSLTERVAALLGWRLRAVGVDLDLAPCADINSNPSNPAIGVRSFGSDANLVARHAAAFIGGLQGSGVAACVKHFPGHGDTSLDTHERTVRIDHSLATLRRREFVPFRAAVDAGVAALMTSHLLVPAVDDVPATISRAFSDLIRADLGFAGPIVTDALDMQGISGTRSIPAAATLALRAGADLLCLGARQPGDVPAAVRHAVTTAIDDGLIDPDALARSVARIATLHQPKDPSPRVVDEGVAIDAARRALHIDGPAPECLRRAYLIEFRPALGVPNFNVAWGLGAAMDAVDPESTSVRLEEADDWHHAVDDALGRPLVAVVRDAHRQTWQRDALVAIERARPDLIVVEMGWPGEERLPGRTCINTYGAARVSADVAADLLGRERVSPDAGD